MFEFKLTDAQIIGAIISYLLGVFLVPFVIYFSKVNNLVDEPNERKIHHGPISRLGGIAIWASAMLTFLLLVVLSYYPYGKLLSGILLGGSLMFLLGLVDEVYLTMERALITGSAVQRLSNQRDILCFKRIATCTKQVKCLSVHKEDRFLTFMNDELR